MAPPNRPSLPENPPDWDLKLLAQRFAARRKAFGWSIDEVAKRAKVSRHTVMRVEAGEPCRYSTIRKLRSALQFFSEQLTQTEQKSEHFRTSHGENNRWLVAAAIDSQGRPVYSNDFLYVDDPAERKRQAGLGFQRFFTCILRSEMPEGVLSQGLMEIYKETPFDQHFGEEFIYCLEGRLRMTVEEDVAILEPGDSIVFDALKRHQYAPAGTPGQPDYPTKILLVVGIRPDEEERLKVLDREKNWGV